MLQINLTNKAQSQTTEAFTSMCKFGNDYLGTTANGLYKICGFSDNGVVIPALIKSGVFDLGVNQKNKFRAFYFSGEATGELKITIYADGIASDSFNIIPNADGIFDIKITYPTNIHARYWQWQIENVDGAFFVLYEVKALPIVWHPGRDRK